ncbi:MAG: M20 family metallo-hydrolase, partial [Promethearchaeota archaeon]
MKFSKENIDQWIESNRKKIIETYKEILRIPALSPENGGDGEWEKATKIIEILTEWGWKNWIKTVSIPDERVSKKSRPNIIITYNPNNSTLPAICSVGHMDVVPVGEIAQWNHDPFDPIEKNGKLYGRGTEDNGLGLITPLAALKCIIDLKLHVSRPIKLILVADEETGSRFGIQPLIEQKLFQSDDLIIVPDAGVKSGLEIEIAEKTPLRAKITTNGLQGHAARPNDALNTQPIANLLATRLYDQLHKQFNEQNELFYPPISTFEPTMRRNNVSNINTLPGRDEQWWDCRLIPETNI